jgi:hypothetical protein
MPYLRPGRKAKRIRDEWNEKAVERVKRLGYITQPVPGAQTRPDPTQATS